MISIILNAFGTFLSVLEIAFVVALLCILYGIQLLQEKDPDFRYLPHLRYMALVSVLVFFALIGIQMANWMTA